ncbi:hypothetical protein AKJ09_05197 [Labilithrix luteola]|uniref:Uncharacterized protein n=1 Tax=Labilithrix luteola TaxID=1391654 RepID=A0A0K1PYC9_9BACT|nr:hypothetical protein [Labilithrix luteola]AKU98533.1 hypothetical protein AKJ09_05197 [Labilithrix luteola]
MEPTAPDLSRAFRLALPVALGLPIVGVGLVSLVDRLSVSLVFTVIATVMVGVLVVATRSKAPRAGIVAGIAAACWSFIGAVAAATKADVPIVWGTDGVRCGTAMMSMLMIVGPIAGFWGFMGGLGLGALGVRRRWDSTMRGLATVATATVLVVTAFEVPKLRFPDADSYVASLEPARSVEVNGTVVLDGQPFRYERHPIQTVPSQEGPPEPTFAQCDLIGGAGGAVTLNAVGTSAPCPAVRFRTDPILDLVVVESQNVPCLGDTCWSPRSALRRTDWTSVSVTPRIAAHRLSAPTGWRIGGAFGSLIAVVAMVVANRLRKRAARLTLIGARHLGGGRVELSTTSEPVLVPIAASLPIGPIVLDGEQRGLPTYRDAGGLRYSSAFAGSLADHRARRTDLAASLTALAFAAAALGATPLVVVRILFGL